VDQHRIEETQLVTRKSARDQIHLAWNYQCAYCGDELNRSPTLDHVVPKALGGRPSPIQSGQLLFHVQ
jgi:5-methylcytosine-specific restriction endonuclease McrA